MNDTSSGTHTKNNVVANNTLILDIPVYLILNYEDTLNETIQLYVNRDDDYNLLWTLNLNEVTLQQILPIE